MQDPDQPASRSRPSIAVKAVVFLMFAIFAMTTDSVGTVIPEIIKDFHLGLATAGSFQYSSMAGIGISAIMLGFLADRLGRKKSIVLGVSLFGASSAMFAAGHSFGLFVLLLFLAGLGIGIFKAGALALIGDISQSTREHRTNMNLIEGFFGVGAIIGPALVTGFVQAGMSWKWVYLIAAALCGMLLASTLFVRFPKPNFHNATPTDFRGAIGMLRDPTALYFGGALMLYVGAEACIYVWAPTYLAGYAGPFQGLALYAIPAFFVLRAAGRFFGAWLLGRFDWSTVLLICTAAVMALFWIAIAGGRDVAIFALPATGLFMSVLYPTINSTGISCHKKARHGAVAGILLFFTCLSAVVAPLAMGAAGDWFHSTSYSIALGAVLATLLALSCLWNWLRQPFARRLRERDLDNYGAVETMTAMTETA